MNPIDLSVDYQKQSGTTILELILVMGLIGIIASTIMLVLDPEEKKAKSRDAQRIADIGTLDRVINEYLLDFGDYPDLVNTLRDSTTLPGSGISIDNASSGWIAENFTDYISHLPIDPINNDTYKYYYFHDQSGYELNATLEVLLEEAADDGGDDSSRYELGNNLYLISP